MKNYKENSNRIHKKNSEPISKMNSTHLAKVVSLPKLKCKIPNCSSKLRGKLIVFPSTGCSKKLLTEEKNPNQSECCGAKFSHENDLILLSLSKKRPKNIFPDIEGAAYGWFKQHSISQLFWDTLYVNIKTSFENFPTFSTKNSTQQECSAGY